MRILETPRLFLRPYEESDLPEYHRLLSDRKNMYYLDDITTGSMEESHESLKAAIEINALGKARRFCVALKSGNKLIGAASYEIAAVTPAGKIADPMGWFIMPEFQNKGYITEAVKRVLEFAFDEDNCVRVATGCYKDNIPTQKVMLKTGFKKEGERVNALWHDGRLKTRLEFAINKEDYRLASRTIENDRDRKMTIMTTTFMPCGAKLPVIALIAGAVFGGAGWVAFSAYFVGIAAVIVSGIILKKSKMFAGDASPFVMELPAYHMPTFGAVMRSMWERGWSFIKKAGSIILLSTIFIWFASNFGFADGGFGMVDMDDSILALLGGFIAPVFAPLGWGNWQTSVAAITGLVAKENVAGTMGILYGYAEVSEEGEEIWGALAASLPAVAAYSFLIFNLLCAPCFAAMGAIRREMNNAKWFWAAIGYQCGLAYVVSLCVYQFGMLFAGSFGVWTIAAFALLAGFLYLLFRPAYKAKGGAAMAARA